MVKGTTYRPWPAVASTETDALSCHRSSASSRSSPPGTSRICSVDNVSEGAATPSEGPVAAGSMEGSATVFANVVGVFRCGCSRRIEEAGLVRKVERTSLDRVGNALQCPGVQCELITGVSCCGFRLLKGWAQAKAFYCARTSPVLTYPSKSPSKCSPPPLLPLLLSVGFGGLRGCSSSSRARLLATSPRLTSFVYEWLDTRVVSFRARGINPRMIHAGVLTVGSPAIKGAGGSSWPPAIVFGRLI